MNNHNEEIDLESLSVEELTDLLLENTAALIPDSPSKEWLINRIWNYLNESGKDISDII